MNLDQLLLDKVKTIQWSETVQAKDSFVLAGCISMFHKTQNSIYKDIVDDYVNRFLPVQGLQGFALGRALSFLYEETKEDKYKAKVGELVNALLASSHKDGILVHEDGSNYSEEEIYSFMPTYAWYETSYNKKEHYIDIMAQLKYFNDQQYDQTNVFLMALADTVHSMSEEIYEYYAQIKTWLKDGVHIALNCMEEASLELAYAILRGCESKALLPEKYEEIGRNMVLAKASSYFVDYKEMSNTDLGILMMAYAIL